jgi:hypothetical protein
MLGDWHRESPAWSSIAGAMLTPRYPSGDMNLPSCLLCIRTSTLCSFPDGRKRRKAAHESQASEQHVLGGADLHASKDNLKGTISRR